MLAGISESPEILKVKLIIKNKKRKVVDELNDEYLTSEAVLQNLMQQKRKKINKDTLRRVVFTSDSNSSISPEALTTKNNKQFENASNLLISEEFVLDKGSYIKLKSADMIVALKTEDDEDIIGNKKYSTVSAMATSDSDEDNDDVENSHHIFLHNQINQGFESAPAYLLSNELAPIPAKTIKYSKTWSDEMDAKLRAAHDQFGDNWVKIAQYVEAGKTPIQCCSRWRTYANPKYEGYLLGPWSVEEENALMDLIPQYRKHPSHGKPFINWIEISQRLNRNELECGKKYESLRNRDCIRGHYTPEEDRTILDAVGHLSPGPDLERGMTQVAQDLNRLRKTVKTRLNVLKNSARPLGSSAVRSGLQDARLAEAVTIHGAKKWAQVADLVGGGINANSCKMRWVRNVNPDVALKRKDPWTEEEIAQLHDLVSAAQRQRGFNVCTDWTTVANALNRRYSDCEKKWRSIQVATLKHGKFTPDEDGIIRRGVAEWADKGRGMWMSLEKELGRSAANIQSRWAQVLSISSNGVVEMM